MPTFDALARLDPDTVRAIVSEVAFPDRGPDHPDQLGLEVEVFPVRAPAALAQGRVRIDQLERLLAGAADIAPTRLDPALDPVYAWASGARLTFEPGGQVEYAGPCGRDGSTVVAAATEALGALARHLDQAGVVLASAGLDAWHDLAGVPQQLTAPRYPAMAAYFDDRGGAGATMMRHTAALQVNLDLGAGRTRDERWLVANLAAPLAVASFTTSPVPGAVNGRARAWQALDPTRTGFPAALVSGATDDPVEQVTRAALDADVLLVRHGREAAPGRTGWTFGAWLAHGHRAHGWPTADDLRYHLTTLFHEVRPRGAFEIRSVDAQPARWRAVPVVLYAGLLYDDRARGRVLGALEHQRANLPRLLATAARDGVADAGLCAAAVETWSYAVEGARRLGPSVVAEADVRRAELYIDRYTMRGRCPGDELMDLLDEDPAAALAWATEPVPTVALC